jgi:hypothetical protein
VIVVAEALAFAAGAFFYLSRAFDHKPGASTAWGRLLAMAAPYALLCAFLDWLIRRRDEQHPDPPPDEPER